MYIQNPRLCTVKKSFKKYICDYEIIAMIQFSSFKHFSCLRRIYLDVEINETERRERNKIYKENRKDHKSFTLLLKNAKIGYKEHE